MSDISDTELIAYYAANSFLHNGTEDWPRLIALASIGAAVRPRPEVMAFATLMEAKLADNEYKGGWKGETPGYLMERAWEEMQEAQEALTVSADTPGYKMNLGDELADVANMLMMVADVEGCLPTPEPTP